MKFVCAILFFAASHAVAFSISDWQGEWGSYKTVEDPNSKSNTFYEGGHISIAACNESSKTCEFSFENLADRNYKRCGVFGQNNRLRLNLLSENTAEGGLSPRGEDCVLKLQIDRSGSTPSLKASLSGKGCHSVCPDPSIVAAKYEQKSKVLFPKLQAMECLADPSPAMQATCTDPEMSKQEPMLDKLSGEIDQFLQVRQYDHRKWRSETLAKCNEADNAKSCMEKEYGARVKLIEGETEKLSRDLEEKSKAAGEQADPAQAASLLKEWEGVYKKRFKNSLVDGTSYDSEDILELVPVGGDAVYFKTHIDGANGHSCGLFGVAHYRKNGVLVFKSTKDGLSGACLLQIKLEKDKISLLDDEKYSCRNYNCGARAAFSGTIFKKESKRRIRYMDRLKNSEDFKKAVGGK